MLREIRSGKGCALREPHDLVGVFALATAVVLGVICVVVQLRPVASLAARIEGQPLWSWQNTSLEGGDGFTPAGQGTRAAALLMRINPEIPRADVQVLVNGEARADFGYGSACVWAARGDLIEFEMISSDSSEVRVEIIAVLGMVKSPQTGSTVQLNPGRTSLGNIIM